MRQADALPFAWDLPSARQLALLLQDIDQSLDLRRRTASRLTLDAIALILLVLQTGAKEAELMSLRVYRSDAPLDVTGIAKGLWSTADEGFIVLDRARHFPQPKNAELYRPILPFIILPQTKRLAKTIERIGPGREAGTPLFASDHFKLRARVNKMLGVGTMGRDTNKASRRTTACRRWLRHRLKIIDGGDPAFFSILDADKRGVEKTLAHYSTTDVDAYWKAYHTALAPIDPSLPRRAPKWLAGQSFGHPRCPDDQHLSSAFASLRGHAQRAAERLDQPMRQIPESLSLHSSLPIRRDDHIAMMIYTFALQVAATGQRHRGHLIDLKDIDPEIHGAWVIEKANDEKNHDGERGIFFCKTAVQQLQQYAAYLDRIEDVLRERTPELALQLRAARNTSPGILFFIIDGDEIKSLSAMQLHKEASKQWPYPVNVGRRWLRSRLCGRVPADALAAQFGHNHDGLSPWSEYSGLDPEQVRKTITTAADAALASIGVTPIDVAAVGPMICQDRARFIDCPRNARARTGQILASAMWNGAFLSESNNAELLTEVRKHVGVTMAETWLELSPRKHGRAAGGRRWRTDPATTSLLRKQFQIAGRNFGLNAEDCLKEFFGGVEPSIVEDFRKRCERRWRLRMPPFLFELASDRAENWSLPSGRFHGGQSEPLPWRGLEVPRRPRATGEQFRLFVLSCQRKGAPSTPRARRQAADMARNTIDREPFYHEMTILERSLARALVDLFDRTSRNDEPDGENATSIADRIQNIWLYFIPRTPQEWEQHPIEEIDIRTLKNNIYGYAPWRANIAQDLLSVLVSLSKNAVDPKVRKWLEATIENSTVDLILPHESEQLMRMAADELRVAFTLTYRTGLRFSELNTIELGRIHSDDQGSAAMLILDHPPNARLKTHHSRRRIPLDILMTEDERADLDRMIEVARHNGQSMLYLCAPVGEDKAVRTALRAATGTATTVFPLRHSTASNALVAILWPRDLKDTSVAQIPSVDHLLLDKSQDLRGRLCGARSLGVTAPYAVSYMLGHTTPWRTLYNYAHNLEVLLAAYVKREAQLRPAQ